MRPYAQLAAARPRSTSGRSARATWAHFSCAGRFPSRRCPAGDGRRSGAESPKREPKQYIKIGWKDVEDRGVTALRPEDGSAAGIAAGAATPGGVHYCREAYLSKARIRADINPSNSRLACAPSPEEDWNQRHPRELLDFVTAIAEGRPPVSGSMLARDVTLVLQAA